MRLLDERGGPGTARAGALTAAEESLALLRELLGERAGLGVRLWDGTAWAPEAGEERATLVLRHPGAVRAMLWPPTELTLGQAYVHGDFDVEGELEAVFPAAERILARPLGVRDRLAWAARVLALPAGDRRDGGGARLAAGTHSLARDRAAVTYHYDRSNAFFRLFLGGGMVYSCAYFEREDEDLETAQEQKLDYVCRKLRLRPGERLLDLGCGWGALLVHAAERYGVEADGITLSEPQADEAAERVRASGLADRCRAEVRDYRELDAPEGYDKLASVGMFEHVGERLLPAYFARAHRLLRPGGVFLNHGIARAAWAAQPRRPTFVSRYVFPDGELVPLTTTLRAAESAGFEVRDVESLREHYALTLRDWVRRLESRREEAVRETDETTYRVWRLYMAGSAHAFAAGRLNVYQVLLAKPDRGRSGLPLTRADWYS